MANQNTGRKNNSSIVPSKGNGTQQLAQRSSVALATDLDRIFEDFRTSFNQLMTPFVASPWYTDSLLAPLSLIPEWTEGAAHVHQARYPVVDVVDEGDHYTVTAELPGFSKENVDVQVGEDGVLQLSARVQSEHKGGRYMSHERSYSAFQRAIQLPEQVIGSKVEGTMQDGILSLRIPKKEPTSTKFTKVALR